MTTPQSNDVYAREVVMARVGHLIRRKQREIERITRILRGLFDPSQVQAPEPGLSNGVQKGPPIGVEEGPPFRI